MSALIDPSNSLASWFLLIATSFFVVAYALPLLFFPLRWARWFQWKLPEQDTDLTVYFGRCTGGLALGVIVIVAQGISRPGEHRYVFDLIGLTCGLMTFVHVWGALRRAQPWTEHLEIIMYGAVAVLAVWIRSSLA